MTRFPSQTTILMKPADLLRELAYPLRSMAIVLAMIFFWLIFAVANLGITSGSPVLALVGLLLFLFIMPAYFRYMLFVLDARANKIAAPVASTELFSFTDNIWTLTPILLLAAFIYVGVFVSGYGPLFALLYAAIIFVLIPASFAVLAITHSPIESLNPAAIIRMVRACGPTYALIPAVMFLFSMLLSVLASLRFPQFLIEIGTTYQAALFFTLTGAVLAEKNIASQVGFETPVEPTEEKLSTDLEKERHKIASHAYGFISRGNREGGFAHIMDWVGQEVDATEAAGWFFKTMMKWESKEPALFYAQIYLAHLLHHEENAKVLKLVSVCLHEDPQWRPKPEDRQHVVDLATNSGRDDLLRLLGN